MTNRIAFIYFFSMVYIISSIGQVRIDSLYPLLKIQSFGNMINRTGDGFFIIGHGTDTVPWNTYGTIFTSFNYDGTVNFTRYKLDQNMEKYYYDLNAIVIDSFAYTTFVGTSPVQILQFNINSGEIVHRTEYVNATGGEYPTFSHSIQKADSTHLIVCSSSLNNLHQYITQLTLFNRRNDSLTYYFNSYLDYDQSITNLIVTPKGFILGGYIRKGDPWRLDFDSHATIIWLDKNFNEIHRYISADEPYEIFGKDIILDNKNSVISTNCIGRKYLYGYYYFDEWRPSIYKVDSTGKFLWQRPMGRNLFIDDHYMLRCLVPSNSGDGYIAAGGQPNFSDSIYYSGANYNEKGENLRFEGLIVKVSNEGDSLWSRWYYKADFKFSRSEFFDMISHPDGGYILAGEANKGPIVEGEPANYTWLLYVDEFGCAVPGCQEIVKTDDPAFPDPIRIYPNPACDELYVFQQENEVLQYFITSIQGQIITQFKCSQGGSTAIVDVKNYAPGQYILTKKDHLGRIRSEKWIKI
jgi:hypothetical protein